MKASCVIGIVDYSDSIIPKEILDKFRLKYFYKNIEDINNYHIYKPIENLVNRVKNKIYKVEMTHELIVYGIEIPVFGMINNSNDSYYEYELAEIYVKKFVEFCFNKFKIDFESPCEYMCVSGDDMDLLFLNSKPINKKIEDKFEEFEYEELEMLRIEILLKEDLILKNIEIGLIESLNKEIILLVAKSKYNLISNTSTANDGDIILSFYLENRKENIDITSSIESLSSVTENCDIEDCEKSKLNKCEIKWFKFIKRKIKKKYHFIEKMSIKKCL